MPSGPCWIKFACHASRVQQVQQSVRTLLTQDCFLGTVTNFSELEFDGLLVIFWVNFVLAQPNPDGPRFLKALEERFEDGFVLFADWDFPKQQAPKKLNKKEWS